MAPLKLVLPSDSSLDLYPDNKIGHYRVRLSEPVIPGAEIALSCITYPTSTTSSGFYVTLPGLVNNLWSPAGSSCVRNVMVYKDGGIRMVVEPGSTQPDAEHMITTSFNHLLFMPLKRSDLIREIEVNIIDSSTGETVQFKGGKIVCTVLISRHDDI